MSEQLTQIKRLGNDRLFRRASASTAIVYAIAPWPFVLLGIVKALFAPAEYYVYAPPDGMQAAIPLFLFIAGLSALLISGARAALRGRGMLLLVLAWAFLMGLMLDTVMDYSGRLVDGDNSGLLFLLVFGIAVTSLIAAILIREPTRTAGIRFRYLLGTLAMLFALAPWVSALIVHGAIEDAAYYLALETHMAMSLLAVAAAACVLASFDLKLAAAFWSMALGITFNIAYLAQLEIREYGPQYPEILASLLFMFAGVALAITLWGAALAARRSPSQPLHRAT
jgi:hypothetical protein